MSTPQFQPSPETWAIEPLQSTHGADMAIVEKGKIIAIIQHDPAIQVVEDPDFDTVRWHSTDVSNTHLLAAAPELLTELRNTHAEIYLLKRLLTATCRSEQPTRS